MTKSANHPELELSPDALYGIAQLALDQVEGVRTITPPTRVGEFLTGRRAKGIVIEREDEAVSDEVRPGKGRVEDETSGRSGY